MSETTLQRSIIKALTQMGVWVVRSAVKGQRGAASGGTGEPGLPDLCIISTGLIHGCCGAQVGWLEVKVPGGKLRPAQLAWHAKARKLGINVATVESVADAVRVVQLWRS